MTLGEGSTKAPGRIGARGFLSWRRLSPLGCVAVAAFLTFCGGDEEGTVSAGANRDAPADVGPLNWDTGAAPDTGSSGPERQGPPDTTLRHGVRGTLSLVIDGDTVHVTVDGWYHRVRLQGINAPECEMRSVSTVDGSQFVCDRDQEWWGLSAYEALRDLAEGVEVEVACNGEDGDPCETDDFDRFLAFLRTVDGDEDVGEWMARQGHAFSFTKFASTRRATYCRAEDLARAEGLGMWSLGDRDEVLARMNSGTRDWYEHHDRLCAEATGGQE